MIRLANPKDGKRLTKIDRAIAWTIRKIDSFLRFFTSRG